MTRTFPRGPATRALPLALAGALLFGTAPARAAEPMNGMGGMGGMGGMKTMRMDHGAATPPGTAVAPVPPVGAQTPADKAYAAANETMMKGMDVKPTGDADRDFVEMMLPHHQGAIDMARVEAQYGRDPLLRKLAADIVAAQEKEIVEMRAWRSKHPGAR